MLMGGCNETVHVRFCHWPTTRLALATKAAEWSTVQANGDVLRDHSQYSEGGSKKFKS